MAFETTSVILCNGKRGWVSSGLQGVRQVVSIQNDEKKTATLTFDQKSRLFLSVPTTCRDFLPADE